MRTGHSARSSPVFLGQGHLSDPPEGVMGNWGGGIPRTNQLGLELGSTRFPGPLPAELTCPGSQGAGQFARDRRVPRVRG